MVSSMEVTRTRFLVAYDVQGTHREVTRLSESAEVLEREMLDTFKRVYKQNMVSNLVITPMDDTGNVVTSDSKKHSISQQSESKNSTVQAPKREVKPMVTKSPKIAVSTKQDKLVSYVEHTPKQSPVDRKAGQQNRMNAVDRYSKTGYSDEQKPVKPTLSIVKKVIGVKTPKQQVIPVKAVVKPIAKQSPGATKKPIAKKPIEKVVKEKKQSTLLDHNVVGDVYSYTEFVQAWVFDNLPDTPQLPDSTKFSYGLVYSVVREECKKAYKNRKHLDDLTVRDCFQLLENYAGNNAKSVVGVYYRTTLQPMERSNRKWVDLACRFQWVMCSYLAKLDTRVAILQEQEIARSKQLQAKQKQLAVKNAEKIAQEKKLASEKLAKEKLQAKNKALAEKNKAKLQASKVKGRK